MVPANNLDGKMIDYVFHGEDESNYLIVLGFGMLYNHSDSPNLTYYLGGGESVVFQATCPIDQGEELTISYGNEWWVSREQVPLSFNRTNHANHAKRTKRTKRKKTLAPI